MKLLSLLFVALLVGAAWQLGASRAARQRDALLAVERAAWEAERAQMTATRRRLAAALTEPVVITRERERVVTVLTNQLSPAAIIAALKQARIPTGPGQAAATRRVIHSLEQLVDAGPAALPAIRAFLAENTDRDFVPQAAALAVPADPKKKDKGVPEPKAPKGPPSGKGPPRNDVLLPASLRLALFEVAARVGGPAAESLLLDTLRVTGRGVELLALARTLEGLAPGRGREVALAATHELLAAPLVRDATGRHDPADREALLGVLALFRDPALAAQVQTQLVAADGQVNPDAFRLFKDTLTREALPSIYTALADPRVTDLKQKEPLLELALMFVGSDARADQLFLEVVASGELSAKLRENSIKHLRGEGLENKDAPTEADRQVLQNRLAHLDRVAPSLTDPKLAGEAAKTRERIVEALTGQKLPKPAGQPAAKGKK